MSNNDLDLTGIENAAPMNIEPMKVEYVQKFGKLFEQHVPEINECVLAKRPVRITVDVREFLAAPELPELLYQPTNTWAVNMHLYFIGWMNSKFGIGGWLDDGNVAIAITGVYMNDKPSKVSGGKLTVHDWYTDNIIAWDMFKLFGHMLYPDDTNPSAFFIYNEERGVWERHETVDRAMALVTRTLDIIKPLVYADTNADDKGDQRRRANINSFDNHGQKLNILRQYRTLDEVRHINVSNFDGEKTNLLLNVENGILHLDTGLWEPHNPCYPIMKRAPVAWAPDAKCPEFELAMQKVYCGDMETLRFAQQSYGLGLTGEVNDKVVFIHNSEEGFSGRSIVKDTLICILGDGDEGYAAEVDPGTFETKQNRSELRVDLLSLNGRRIVFTSEPTRGGQFDVTLLKRIAGMDKVTTRGPHMKKMVSFMPRCKIHVLSNHIPNIPGDDTAMIRRLRIISYAAKFTEQPEGPNEYAVDREIGRKLKQERSGILNWMLAGYLDYRRENLISDSVPESVKLATGEYLSGIGDIDSFAEECLIVTTDGQPLGSQEAYRAYRQYMQCEGYGPNYIAKNKTFTTNLTNYMKRKGFEQVVNMKWTKSGEYNGRKVWLNLRLRNIVDDMSTDFPRVKYY